MVNYHLVPAANADFDFLYELKKVAYREYIDQTWGWDEAFQLKFHRENFAVGNTKIIKANNEPVGSVDVTEGDVNIFISGLYLLPAYQANGVGTKILNDLINKSKLKNKRLELEVLKVNTRAISLYQRLGFTMTEGDKHKYFMYYRST